MLALLVTLFLPAASPALAAGEGAVLSSSTAFCVDFVIELRGDPLSATPLEKEEVGVVPFGLWLNAIQIKNTDQGFQFATQVEDCSTYGCTLESGDTFRTIIAKSGISDAIRFTIYDEKWQKAGPAAISDRGWVAVPMSSPSGSREIWVIKADSRMHRRIPNPVMDPAILKWRGEDLFMIHALRSETFKTERVLIDERRFEEVPPNEPYFFTRGGREGNSFTAGYQAEYAGNLEGRLKIPLYGKRSEQPGSLLLTSCVRPMTSGGFADPVRILVDNQNRINVVTALRGAIWLMRFGEDGNIIAASRVAEDVVGDAGSIRIDSSGSFNFLHMEIDKELAPVRIHYARFR